MSALQQMKPTCIFIGGPWDGREHYYSILAVSFYIPDAPNCTTMALDNIEIGMVPVIPHHVYVRGTMMVHRNDVYAQYFYKGVRS